MNKANTDVTKMINWMRQSLPEMIIRPQDFDFWVEALKGHDVDRIRSAFQQCMDRYRWHTPILALIMKQIMIEDNEWSEEDEKDPERIMPFYRLLTQTDWFIAFSNLDARYLIGLGVGPAESWNIEMHGMFWNCLCYQLKGSELRVQKAKSIKEIKNPRDRILHNADTSR